MHIHAHKAHTVIVLKLMHCSWQSASHQLSRAHLLISRKVSAKGGRLHLEMLLGFPGIHRHGQAIRAWWGVQSWVLVQVGQQERGADGGSVVQPRASVSVPACSVGRTGLSVALCADEIGDHTGVSVVITISQHHAHTAYNACHRRRQSMYAHMKMDLYTGAQVLKFCRSVTLPLDGPCAHGRACAAIWRHRSSPDLEVERAIDSILLCSEDGGKMLSHAAYSVAVCALTPVPSPRPDPGCLDVSQCPAHLFYLLQPRRKRA